MIDTYAWNVMRESDVVELRPGPGMTGFYYYASTEHGMMHFDWGHIDRYTAVMMNAMAGQRARRGNYNEPWDLGWFLDDIPAGNRVQFLRYDGRPVANTPIRIYRAKPAPEVAPYAMRFSAPPDFNFTTDGEGRVTLPANVFADDGITAFVDRSNGVAVVELLSEPQRQWAFLESLHFNLAWHRGHRDMAEYTVTTNRPACPDGLGPSASRPEADVLVSTPSVTLQFPVWFERRYRLFYAVDGGDPVSLDVGPFTDTPARITLSLPPGRINWWFVDLEPPFCPPARSSLFAFDHELLDGPRRRAVGR
jgi:hypothetical protein